MSGSFTLGASYTRKQIGEELGGNEQSYLPHRAGRVVCVCLDPALNPEAPRVILPGTGEGIEGTAAMLRRQAGSLPVFLKQAAHAWKYVGMWEVSSRTWTPADVEEHARRTGRTDITSVIWLTASALLRPARTIREVAEAVRGFGATLREKGAPRRRLVREPLAWLMLDDAVAPAMWAAYGDVDLPTYLEAKRSGEGGVSEVAAVEILERLGCGFVPDAVAADRLVVWADSVEKGLLAGTDLRGLRCARLDPSCLR